jgi:hypothetical protein
LVHEEGPLLLHKVQSRLHDHDNEDAKALRLLGREGELAARLVPCKEGVVLQEREVGLPHATASATASAASAATSSSEAAAF